MRLGLAVLIGAFLAVFPAVAHHGFAAEFDSAKPIVLKGTVTKLEWFNPHVHFCIDVKDANGNVTHWELEMASPNTLMRSGWNRNSLKPGDVITVEAWSAKDGSKLAFARDVTLANGRKVFAGSADDGAGAK